MWNSILAPIPGLLIGTVGGSAAWLLGLPLPWLMGSLIATLGVSLGGAALPVSPSVRAATLSILGVLLGSAITPDATALAGQWVVSIAVMLTSSAIMCAIGLVYGIWVAGYAPITAWFSGIPGGFSVMAALGPTLGGDARAIALSHSTRIALLLITIPPTFTALVGEAALIAAADVMATTPDHPGITVADWLILGSCAGIGAGLGFVARFPAAFITFPMLLSAAVHLTGLTSASPPDWTVAIAQVVSGTTVGCRFGGTRLRELAGFVLHAMLLTGILMGVAAAASWITAQLTDLSYLSVLLANIPGGASEMGVIALSLDIDPAMVATHHIIRVAGLVLIIPVVVRFFVHPAEGKGGGAVGPP